MARNADQNSENHAEPRSGPSPGSGPENATAQPPASVALDRNLPDIIDIVIAMGRVAADDAP